MIPQPLDRMQFDAASLIDAHPPRWHHPNKQAIYDLVLASGHAFGGQIAYARWPALQLPSTLTVQNEHRISQGVFAYLPPAKPDDVDWHVNFADPSLFVAYASPLFAQDELQVAEHPILGSLREALVAMQKRAETVDARHEPTPITISGVQRFCAVDTRPNPGAGRPRGMYGNRFAHESVRNVIAATTLISPPTITNLLAMAAPACGHGEYSHDEIKYIVSTAYTGFAATRRESAEFAGEKCRTVVNTGFWGCGAFGGNRTLMTMLQALAADLADVQLVFHAFDAAGVDLAGDAWQRYGRMRTEISAVEEMLEALVQEEFQWGESDGN